MPRGCLEEPWRLQAPGCAAAGPARSRAWGLACSEGSAAPAPPERPLRRGQLPTPVGPHVSEPLLSGRQSPHCHGVVVAAPSPLGNGEDDEAMNGIKRLFGAEQRCDHRLSN